MFFSGCSNFFLFCKVWKLKEKFENRIMVMKLNGLYDLPKDLCRNTFKWTRQLYIFILKFQTAIFGAKIVTNTWKKFTSEIEHFRAAFDIG